MADKVKRNTANGASAKSLSTPLEAIFRNLDDLRKEAGGSLEYDGILSTQLKLNRQIKEKDLEIQKLEREKNEITKKMNEQMETFDKRVEKMKNEVATLDRHFEEKFRKWDSDSTRHWAESTQLERFKGELQRLQRNSEVINQENSRLNAILQKKTREAEDYKKKIESMTKEIQIQTLSSKIARADSEEFKASMQHMKEQIGILPLNLESMKQRIRCLATTLRNLVWDHFDTGPLEAIGCLQEDHYASPLAKIPLVNSDSIASRYMRRAFAETLISQELSRLIFRTPYTMLSNKTGHEGVNSTLLWLSRIYPSQGSIVRCQIAMACDSIYESEGVVVEATEGVCRILTPWINDSTKKNQFSSGLKTKMNEAVQIWRELQRAEEEVTCITSIASLDWCSARDAREDYSTLENDKQQPIEAETSELIMPLAILFPQFWVGATPLFRGSALYPTQASVVAAKLEAGKHKVDGINEHSKRISRINERSLNPTAG